MKIKVVELKPQVEEGVLVFKVEKQVEEKSFNEIENITDDLIDLNLQRYLIRRNKEAHSNTASSKIHSK
jgi:hypothetical protein